jgi:hypothetical protein
VANSSTFSGFSQRNGNGSAPTYEQVEGLIDAATAAIYYGDPIFHLSDGTLAGATTGPGPGTEAIAGIFVGCKYLSVAAKKTTWSNYWPGSDVAAGTFATAMFINDPNAQFTCQMGGSTTVGFVQADVGLNAQFAYGTPNAANGLSGAYIDETIARATTSTFPFRVIGIITAPPGAPNTTAGAYNLGVVAFNNVETKALTAAN